MAETGVGGPALWHTLARDVIEALPDGVLIERADRSIEYANQPFADMFLNGDLNSLSEANCELIARNTAGAFVESSTWLENTEQLVREHKPRRGEQWELRDGHWIERDYIPRFAGGKPAGHIWLYRDITAQQQVLRDLREVRAKLASRRTPVTAKSPEYDPEGNSTITIVDAWLKEGPAALALLRLEHVDRMNDAFGRTTGDAVIRQAMIRLRRELTPRMHIERVGGATFAISIAGDHDPVDLMREARDAFGTIVDVDGNAIMVQVTIGAASLNPSTEVPNARLLLRRARLALAEGRRARHDLVFDGSLLDAERTRDQLALALPTAVRGDELTLVFQPIVSLADRSVAGHETLARWQHETFGTIGAATFVPIAETMGIVSDLDAWVIDHALAVMPQVLAHGGHLLTVNISGGSLVRPELLLPSFERAFADHGIEPGTIVTEITETAVSSLGDAARQTVRALDTMGVQIAIDDFGVGSSSLGLLRDIPFHFIKLDRSFIRSIHDERVRTLVSATTAVAETFGAVVIAEGIEHEPQIEPLIECGVQLGQGWLFAPATPLG